MENEALCLKFCSYLSEIPMVCVYPVPYGGVLGHGVHPATYNVFSTSHHISLIWGNDYG